MAPGFDERLIREASKALGQEHLELRVCDSDTDK